MHGRYSRRHASAREKKAGPRAGSCSWAGAHSEQAVAGVARNSRSAGAALPRPAAPGALPAMAHARPAESSLHGAAGVMVETRAGDRDGLAARNVHWAGVPPHIACKPQCHQQHQGSPVLPKQNKVEKWSGGRASGLRAAGGGRPQQLRGTPGFCVSAGSPSEVRCSTQPKQGRPLIDPLLACWTACQRPSTRPAEAPAKAHAHQNAAFMSLDVLSACKAGQSEMLLGLGGTAEMHRQRRQRVSGSKLAHLSGHPLMRQGSMFQHVLLNPHSANAVEAENL